MIINSIEMTNFISHEKTYINFEPGVNIITGKNGAGKTSILDAIKFALFSDSRNDEKINELIKKGKKFFDIILTFNINNNKYELYKYFGLKSAKNAERNAYLKRDSVIIAETYEGVTSEITKILGVSKEIFKNSVFVEQGEMDSLISGTPKERKTIFSDIIGITSLSKNADKLRDIINRLRNESLLLGNSNEKMASLKEENNRIEDENNNFEKEYKIALAEENNYKNKLNEMEKSIRDRDNLINKINLSSDILKEYNNDKSEKIKESNEISEEIKRFSGIENELNSIKSNIYYKNHDNIADYFEIKNRNNLISDSINDIKNRIDTYNNYKKNLENLRDDYNKYSNIKEIYNKNKNSMKELLVYYNEYNSNLSLFKNTDERINEIKSYINENIAKYNINNISDIKNNRNIINNKIMEYTDNISKIKSEVSSSNPYLTEYNNNISTLKGKNKCPLCGSTLSEDHLNNIINEYESKKNEILSKIETLKNGKRKYEDEINELKKQYDILNSDAVDKIISYNNQLIELNKSRDGLNAKLGSLKEKYDNYINLSSENEKYEDEINKLQENYDKYNKYLNLISAINIDEINNSLKDKEMQYSKNAEAINKIISSIGFIPEELKFKSINNLSNKIDELTKENEKLITLKESYKTIKSAINEFDSKISEMNNKINSLRNTLNEYGDIDSEYNNLKGNYENARSSSIRLSTVIKSNSDRIKANSEEIKNLTNDVNKYNKINNAIKELNKIRESFDYNGIQSMIRKDASAAVTNSTRKYLLSFNLDFDDISIDENFDIKISQNSMEQSIDSLSGGEKTALAIALRLSVAEYVLDKISTIIMDEPTNFLDEDRRNNLKDIIQYSLKGDNIIPQLIMITHHGELTSVGDVSYEVIKENGTSKVITN